MRNMSFTVQQLTPPESSHDFSDAWIVVKWKDGKAESVGRAYANHSEAQAEAARQRRGSEQITFGKRPSGAR